MKKFKTFDITFFVFLFSFLVLLYLSVTFFPQVLVTYLQINLQSKDLDLLSNSIGNIVGTLVAMLAAFLTFIAFWVQYTANKQQWHSIQIDRLENRIFELLNLHKQNTNELQIRAYSGNEVVIISGRNIFPFLFDEFRNIYLLLSNLDSFQSKKNIVQIAYTIYFIGIKDENKDYLTKLLSLYCTQTETAELIKYFRDLQETESYNVVAPQENVEFIPKIFYVRYNGYQSELGHYYRNLFQSIKFIDEYQPHLLSDLDKYNYTKSIRAQLSNYEQLLLYYNTLTSFGKPWLQKNKDGNYLDSYLIKYKMIKNLPLPLADFGIKPEELFKKEIDFLGNKKPSEALFELQEIINSSVNI